MQFEVLDVSEVNCLASFNGMGYLRIDGVFGEHQGGVLLVSGV